MKEVTITTNKAAVAHVWGWEVPVYLFLGGLTAGLLIVTAWMILKKRGSDRLRAVLSILAPLFISIGMGALFLDLEHKLYVWRFYTTFKITSPMSWGSWILMLVYPVSVLMILGTLRGGFPAAYEYLTSLTGKFVKRDKLDKFFGAVEKSMNKIAVAAIPSGIALGIYTGILLGALGARPFWNSPVMGPLFLVSGLSTAVALVLMFSLNHDDKVLLTKIDAVLIIIEGALLLLFILGMMTSSEVHMKAVSLIMGGVLTPVFWAVIVGMGLLIPFILEMLELKGREIPVFIPSLLVLTGGLVLRFLLVEGGQMTGWI